MKVAIISRSTLYTIPGGDTVQIINTTKYLAALGIRASIHLTHETLNYNDYDLLHFFNLTRPADIIYHIKKSSKPFVASPNLVRYHEYDKLYRVGIAGKIFKFLAPNSIEYLKTIARWLNGSDKLKSVPYLWKGHQKSIQEILRNASVVLPNSEMENIMLRELYGVKADYAIIPNGVDTGLFVEDITIKKDKHLVLCVARIEGIKNQLNLIKALNKTPFTLLIIGSNAGNQKTYYNLCKEIAADNIHFIHHITQKELLHYYQRAKVHILPSWFESCGLSTLEAGAMGCNVVITDKGYTREYYEDFAFYCDPSSPQSILDAVNSASSSDGDSRLKNKILQNYTWHHAAWNTAKAYERIISKQ